MIRQDTLSPPPGSKKDRKRVGRGIGSGHGTFSGRGSKGQKARAGGTKVRPGFEGGQLPMIKKLPEKRGFFNPFRIEYSVVNLDQLNSFRAGSNVTAEKLHEAGMVKSLNKPVKVLATGELKKALTIKVNKFSAAAKTKIEAAGGKAEEVEYAAKTK